MKNISVETKLVPNLTDLEKNQMWDLFSLYYDDIEKNRFLEDLSEKQKVLILKKDKVVKGFSTFLIYETYFGEKKYRVLFTGDTIKDRAFWGEKSMNRGFTKFLISEWLANPSVPFYWFLISKGYKTYLFAARNLVEFWPSYKKQTPPHLSEFLDHLAFERYGDAHVPGKGILQFSEKMGKLLETVAPLTREELKVPEIAFYQSQNPGHTEGDELCCLGKIDLPLFLNFLVRPLSIVYSRSIASQSFSRRRVASIFVALATAAILFGGVRLADNNSYSTVAANYKLESSK